MIDAGIYNQIAARTGGDIYIGVVGPVRTGKSTLIKRFTENLILPNIEAESVRERAKDEMPQSASGRTVMTTEPKFIPETAVSVSIDKDTLCRIKLIDCVGYIVPGAMGLIEDGQPRMVMTPWGDDPLPFEEAAEIGTRKVIREHSTIGIVVTTDGTIGDLPAEAYKDAERRVVEELKEIEKPFVIILNSARPSASQTIAMAQEMESEYGIPVLPVNCMDMNETHIKEILRSVLYRFPIRELSFSLPSWLDILEEDSELKSEIISSAVSCAHNLHCMGDVHAQADMISIEGGISAKPEGMDLGSGSATVKICIPDKIFYNILGSKSGFEIENEKALLSIMTELSEVKKKYDRVADAIDSVMNDGYGIVMPTIDELTLEEPEIVKQPGGYGVKLKASAPSIHMMKADIETEVNPIVGTESQSEELVSFLLKEFEEDPRSIWESNMFGKTLHELVSEGLNSKLAHMPDDARAKIAGTIQKIINEGSGGLICILL